VWLGRVAPPSPRLPRAGPVVRPETPVCGAVLRRGGMASRKGVPPQLTGASRPGTIDPRHTIDNSGSGLVWLGRVAPAPAGCSRLPGAAARLTQARARLAPHPSVPSIDRGVAPRLQRPQIGAGDRCAVGVPGPFSGQGFPGYIRRRPSGSRERLPPSEERVGRRTGDSGAPHGAGPPVRGTWPWRGSIRPGWPPGRGGDAYGGNKRCISSRPRGGPGECTRRDLSRTGALVPEKEGGAARWGQA
jgi:hypothetical protein